MARAYYMVDVSLVGKLNAFKARVDSAIERLVSVDPADYVSVTKNGGITFVRVGRFGGSFYAKKRPIKVKSQRPTNAQYEEMMEACHVIPDARIALALRTGR